MVERAANTEQAGLPEGKVIFQEKGDSLPRVTEFPNGVFAVEDSFLHTTRLASYLSLIRGRGFNIDQVIFTEHNTYQHHSNLFGTSTYFNGAIILTTQPLDDLTKSL